MIVYKITNMVNNKIYIGITTTLLSTRMSAYKSNCKAKRHYNQRILMAMIKYGFEKFLVEEIDRATSKEILRQLEVNYISKFKSANPNIGYNVSPGGELHSDNRVYRKGYSLTQEHKNKIRISLTGVKHSPERIQKSSKSRKGIPSPLKGVKRPNWSNRGSFKKGMTSPNKGRKKVIINGKVRMILPHKSTLMTQES